MTRPAPLRFGVLGAARIARGFVVGVRGSATVAVTAVASRDAGRAQAFATEFGVPDVFGSYDAMLASDRIDAVYNPLPNSLHAHWSIRAMEAGKHVLCEKPLAVSRDEAMRMFGASRAYGVRLAEAYPYRSQPQTLEMQRLLLDGIIGNVRTIHAAFGYQLTDRSDIRFDPALAGGALMDLGCYPLSLIQLIAEQPPHTLHARGVWDASGVDRAAIVSLTYGTGILAQATCSFETAIHRQALIAGDAGVIETTFANQTTDVPPVLRVRRGVDRQTPVEEISVPGIKGFLAEAEAFAAHVAGAPWTGMSEAESVEMAALLASARAQLAPSTE